jgi:hypothetical protein
MSKRQLPANFVVTIDDARYEVWLDSRTAQTYDVFRVTGPLETVHVGQLDLLPNGNWVYTWISPSDAVEFVQLAAAVQDLQIWEDAFQT